MMIHKRAHYRELLRELFADLPQDQHAQHAAKILGLTPRTSRRYASPLNEHEIPAPVIKLLRLAVNGKISLKDIEKA